jgi:hypothetical protein
MVHCWHDDIVASVVWSSEWYCRSFIDTNSYAMIISHKEFGQRSRVFLTFFPPFCHFPRHFRHTSSTGIPRGRVSEDRVKVPPQHIFPVVDVAKKALPI